jgi:hypothetical protein
MLRCASHINFKRKEKKESSLGVGGGWLSSFFEKIQP